MQNPAFHATRGGSLQAAVLTEPGRVELRKMDDPVAGNGEATVRIRAVGICGTDLGIFHGKIPVAYPRIMGHEMMGQVVAAPGGSFEPGARVIVDPNVACLRCARCREGRANLCAEGWLLGRDRDGALCEQLVAPVGNLYGLPPELEDDLVPLIQVLTTCVHAQRRVRIFPGESVVVVGLGVTGLLHVQLAKLRGADPVVGVTRSPRALELGGELGADLVISADDAAAERSIVEATRGGGDVVIEAAGTVATLARAVRVARSGGRVVAYGTIWETGGRFPFYDLYYKELSVSSPRAAQAEDYPVAIGAVASGRVQLGSLVSRRVDPSELQGALEEPVGLKTIVDLRRLG